MFFYYVLLSILILFALLNPFLKKDLPISVYIYLVLGVILVVFSGIRYDLGYDYMSYKEIYDDSLVMDREMKESGFAWIMHVCRIWRIPFEYIVFVFSAITVWLAFRFIWQYSPLVFLSVLMFYCFGQYYFNSFNAMRQILVVYAFLSSLHWIAGKRWMAYFLLLGTCAVFIHASALFLFPLYFILPRDYSLMLKGIFLAGGIIGTKIIVWLIGISGYAIYLEFDEFATEASASTYFLLLLASGFFIWDVLQGKKLPEYRLLFNLNFLSLFVLILVILFGGTPLVMAANRISYYFTPVYLVFLPIAIVRLWVENNYFVHILFWTIIYCGMFYVTLELNGIDNNLVPYRTIFNI